MAYDPLSTSTRRSRAIFMAASTVSLAFSLDFVQISGNEIAPFVFTKPDIYAPICFYIYAVYSAVMFYSAQQVDYTTEGSRTKITEFHAQLSNAYDGSLRYLLSTATDHQPGTGHEAAWRLLNEGRTTDVTAGNQLQGVQAFLQDLASRLPSEELASNARNFDSAINVKKWLDVRMPFVVFGLAVLAALYQNIWGDGAIRTALGL